MVSPVKGKVSPVITSGKAGSSVKGQVSTPRNALISSTTSAAASVSEDDQDEYVKLGLLYLLSNKVYEDSLSTGGGTKPLTGGGKSTIDAIQEIHAKAEIFTPKEKKAVIDLLEAWIKKGKTNSGTEKDSEIRNTQAVFVRYFQQWFTDNHDNVEITDIMKPFNGVFGNINNLKIKAELKSILGDATGDGMVHEDGGIYKLNSMPLSETVSEKKATISKLEGNIKENTRKKKKFRCGPYTSRQERHE